MELATFERLEMFMRGWNGSRLAGLALAMLGAAAAHGETDRLLVNAMRYDQEYPVIQYSGPARDNRIWRLQQQLNSGKIKLQWEPKWGYLRSLLKALEIDISSQTMVFSKTSLQTTAIAEKTAQRSAGVRGHRCESGRRILRHDQSSGHGAHA
jgi:hypothetical protein